MRSDIKQVLKGSAAEVHQRQIDIYRKLSFSERFHQECSISDTARQVVAGIPYSPGKPTIITC